MSTAEECKANGNTAFHAKNFSEAVEWYTKAIGFDPRNAIFLNNRAAAYLEMQRFKEAAADAQMSANLSPTGKANGRHGRALAALGQTAEAIQAYERALRLDPSNADFKTALQSLRGSAGGKPQPTPQGAASARAFQLDAAVLVAGVLYLPMVFLAPGFAQMAWQLALVAFFLRQLLTLVASTVPADQLRSFGFWKDYAMTRATKEFSGQYMALCGVFLLTQASAQQFFFVAMALYAAVDVITAQRPHLDAIICGNRFEAMLAPKIHQAVTNRQQLFLQAAACEAMSLFTMPIGGCPIIAMVVAMQFVKWRYRTDTWAQHAWRGLHMQVRQLAAHPRCPGILLRAFDKLAELLHRAGSS